MLEVLRYTGLEGSFTEAISPTAVLVHGAIFRCELAVHTRLIIGAEAKSSILQLWYIGEAISVNIDHPSAGVLAEDHRCCPAILCDESAVEARGRHQRSIAVIRTLVAGVAVA